ncbi:hypothetical protein [Phenylobacterium sp.]|uniref:phage adaptor protein n=1 Tax=Phenylobacterium sp. TaxID=1871053 RepID=UPI0035B4EBE1
MAITTYAQLQSAVADWLERRDLTARIPDFISLAEARFNRVLRLRLMEVETSLVMASGARKVSLPAGFREPLALWINQPRGRRRLRFVDPIVLEVSTCPGSPDAWTVDGDQLAFDRPCDRMCDVTLRMLGRLTLSDATPTNPLLADYPDLYLFGALVEAAPYLRDAEMLGVFMGRLDAALAEVRAKEARARSLSILSVEPELQSLGALAGGV